MCSGEKDRYVSLDYELSQVVWVILSTIHNASDVPHRLDIAGLLTRADRTLKAVTDCGFESRFHQYFLPDMRPQLPIFFKACQKFLVGIVARIISGLEVRRGMICSSILEPTVMKSGVTSRVLAALELCCRTFATRRLMSSGSAVDVHQQYSEVVAHFCNDWARNGGDALVVPDLVNLWLGYPHWDVRPELFHFIRLMLVCLSYEYQESSFEDSVCGAMEATSLLSSIEFVRSWYHPSRGCGGTYVSTVLAESCVASLQMVVRLDDVNRCNPWASLLTNSRESFLEVFLQSDPRSLSTAVDDDTYCEEWMARLEELNAATSSRKRKSTTVRGRGSTPVATSRPSSSNLVVQTSAGRNVVSGPRLQGDITLFSRVAYKSLRGGRGQRSRGAGRRKLADIGREEGNE